MSPAARKNAVIIAVISTISAIAVALIKSGIGKPAAPEPSASAVENGAQTTGPQSPAVAGAKDVTITYGDLPAKNNQAKSPK